MRCAAASAGTAALSTPCRGERVRKKLEPNHEFSRGTKECLSWEWAGGNEDLWGWRMELLAVPLQELLKMGASLSARILVLS